MNLKISVFEEDDKLSSIEFGDCVSQNAIFKNEPLVFERNENSDLVPIQLPVTQEFFEGVFDPSGPFWKLYSQAGFAAKPVGAKYAAFIRGRMYFLKNAENRFMSGLGPERSFRIKGDLLVEEKKANIPNFLLTFAYPFDALGQFAKTLSLGFLVNESVKSFETFKRDALGYYSYYSDETHIDDPLTVAKDSLMFAISALAYTNLAILSYNLKIKFKGSNSIEKCELEELNKLVKQQEWDMIKEKFGFYSLAPYDASKPRFSEDLSDLKRYGAPPSPQEISLKWRENAKFLASRYLAVERTALRKLGRIVGLDDLIFYLKISELENDGLSGRDKLAALKELAERRKKQFEILESMEMPAKIICYGKIYEPVKAGMGEKDAGRTLQGLSVSAKKKAAGPAININSFSDYRKFAPGSIIVSKTLSPNLAILFGRSAGAISESGGALSHAALVARELGIPCLVQAKIGKEIRDGQYLEIDGKTGTIKLAEDSAQTPGSLKAEENSMPEKKAGKKQAKMNEDGGDDINAKSITWLDEAGFSVRNNGTKAMNLSRLYRSSYPVPLGFSVSSKLFKDAIGSKEIRGLVSEIQKMDLGQMLRIDELSKKIKRTISDHSFSVEFEKELEKNFDKLAFGPVAVRSSSSLEDLGSASFAGQFETYLNVKGLEELKKSIKECWASFYSTRAIMYRLGNNINDEDAGMAVLVEQMVKAKYSGVMFTEAPDKNGKILIEAVAGEGESLVSGKASPESYLLNKADLAIVESKADSKMNSKLIRDIADLGLKIEKDFNAPQDIEWCVDQEGKVWILQSRPITTLS